MKTIYACLILVIFFFSCTNDEAASRFASDASSNTTAFSRISDTSAINQQNPFDAAGIIHNELLAAYMSATVLPATVGDIVNHVDLVANANSGFTAIVDINYQKLSSQQVQDFLDNPTSSLSGVIDNSGMTTAGKSALSTFAADFLQLCKDEDDYSTVYDFIVFFEADILSGSLPAADKKLILTTTSLVRHSQFRRKKPKKNTDLDWEINVFHLVGGIHGATTGTAQAITSSLSLGIAENQ